MAAPVADASQGAKGACQPGYAKLPLLVKKIHELLEPRPKWSSLPIVLNCFAGAQLYARGIRPEAAKLLDRNATLTKQYQEEGCDEAEMLRRKLLTRVEEEGLSDIEKNDKDEVFMRISMELRKEVSRASDDERKGLSKCSAYQSCAIGPQCPSTKNHRTDRHLLS